MYVRIYLLLSGMSDKIPTLVFTKNPDFVYQVEAKNWCWYMRFRMQLPGI